jgi:peptidyl-tRNA hydrolase, PTH2 family
MELYEHTSCAKIALKCPTEEEMELIAVKVMKQDIPYYMVEYAGRTQIVAGSRTVFGLGQAPAYVFEEISFILF